MATVHFADLVTRGATAVNTEALNALGQFFTEDEIVELTLVIGLANMTNRVSEGLKIQPDHH